MVNTHGRPNAGRVGDLETRRWALEQALEFRGRNLHHVGDLVEVADRILNWLSPPPPAEAEAIEADLSVYGEAVTRNWVFYDDRTAAPAAVNPDMVAQHDPGDSCGCDHCKVVEREWYTAEIMGKN